MAYHGDHTNKIIGYIYRPDTPGADSKVGQDNHRRDTCAYTQFEVGRRSSTKPSANHVSSLIYIYILYSYKLYILPPVGGLIPEAISAKSAPPGIAEQITKVNRDIAVLLQS